MTSLLDRARERLGWPRQKDIFSPKGSGPKYVAESADTKIGAQIRRISGCEDAKLGIISADPSRDYTEAPLALICEFQRPVLDSTLLALQKLAWNFSRSPQIICVEPHLIRSFTCCKAPGSPRISDYAVAEVDKSSLETQAPSLSQQAANSLHWVQFVSGKFFQDRRQHFKHDQRADQLLLSNLKDVRSLLLEKRLHEEICHDLLARIIFIQFLMDRKDSSGQAALDECRLNGLFQEGVLQEQYRNLAEILRNKDDTYRFFRYLDGRFNGDLFAGMGDPQRSGEGNWSEEMRHVEPRHLQALADFIDGKLEVRNRQLRLWKEYSFDVIPLEFVSSIYEEFLKGDKDKEGKEAKGGHYTPGHIVDYVLDGVLPWGGRQWDLRILDPACGSAIFLVKAYQRLIYRWKQAHPNQKPSVDFLRDLLTKHIFGIDINQHAVRVASFSLYLAMCDEIEPITLWQRVKFPALRGQRIICGDFFEEDKKGFRTREDAQRYDLVIGNVPWGKDVVTAPAQSWASRNPEDIWPIANKNAGPLFLVKAAALTKAKGQVSMVQPAQALLTNRETTAAKFRQRLFRRFKVENITNLSVHRFNLFPKSISPAAIITLCPQPPDGEPITYICPKLMRSPEDDHRITVDPYDVNHVFPNEAATQPEVWSTLMWGGRRDVHLLRTVRQSSSLTTRIRPGAIQIREGIIRGDRKKVQEVILNRRILESEPVPEGSFLRLRAAELPKNTDPRTDSRASTDFSAFNVPQLVIGQTWKSKGRFRAYLVSPDSSAKGILCSQSYISVHADEEFKTTLDTACLTYNSILAVYYLFLTSGRCAGYIPEALVEELLTVPIPEPRSGMMENVSSFDDVDTRVRDAFALGETDWRLVQDFARYTLADFKGGPSSPGRVRTARSKDQTTENLDKPTLSPYCEWFRKVLKAGFGREREISFTIFEEPPAALLPVRLVAIHLNSPQGDRTNVEQTESADLFDRLNKLYHGLMNPRRASNAGVCYHRIARVYDAATIGGRIIPTIYLIKPDQVRYWSCSAALRDADDVAADIMSWQGRSVASAFRKGK